MKVFRRLMYITLGLLVAFAIGYLIFTTQQLNFVV